MKRRDFVTRAAAFLTAACAGPSSLAFAAEPKAAPRVDPSAWPQSMMRSAEKLAAARTPGVVVRCRRLEDRPGYLLTLRDPRNGVEQRIELPQESPFVAPADMKAVRQLKYKLWKSVDTLRLARKDGYLDGIDLFGNVYKVYV